MYPCPLHSATLVYCVVIGLISVPSPPSLLQPLEYELQKEETISVFASCYTAIT